MTLILSPFKIAQQAIVYWDYSNSIVAVAVAIPESAGGDAHAEGDHVSVTSRPDGSSCWPYICTEFASIGLWQINQCANYEILVDLFLTTNPCNIRDHLRDPADNARAAYHVWLRQGWGAWSVYNLGLHLQYMALAATAVNEALKGPPPPTPVGGVPPPQQMVEPPWQLVEPPWQLVEPP